ncbi:MAG: TspO/MBR family protein [Sphingorhabdus sp.]
MSQLASPSQLRMSLLRWALFTVPTIMLLGFLSGRVSGSGEGNSWFAELVKPAAQPPGWAFGVVWPILYLLMGIAFAIILNARGARLRGLAIGLFIVQLALNLFWSPLFFGRHEVTAAFYLLLAIWIAAFATTLVFGRVRALAAWLMVPYLAWLSFAAILNYQIDRLNPEAERLYVPAATSQIGG